MQPVKRRDSHGNTSRKTDTACNAPRACATTGRMSEKESAQEGHKDSNMPEQSTSR